MKQGVFPGGQLAVCAPGVELAVVAGRTARADLPSSRPVTPRTRFDIASLTKALCTSVLLMQAVDGGRVELDDTLDRWFPDLPEAGRLTIGLVASHRSGLAAHRPFYETIHAEHIADADAARHRLHELIFAEPLAVSPNTETIYSDLGYILLAWLLESTFDQRLDELFDERIAKPIGLSATSFGPIDEPVAATEWDEAGRILAGRVHDENARAIGGIACHAGLFSTAVEVMKLMRHLSAVHRGVSGIVSSDVVRSFWRPMPQSSYGLGWDTPTEPSSSGRYTTRGAAVGHLGFTGCSVWHDIARDVTVAHLSNRVHPTRENDRIRAYRPALHDGVNEWLERIR